MAGHHDKSNNNEKVLNAMRIIKLYKRHGVSKCPWENGSDRLTQCRVAPTPQFVKMQQSKA